MAPVFSDLQHPATSTGTLCPVVPLWMGSGSAERSCTPVPSGAAGVVISSMQPIALAKFTAVVPPGYRYTSEGGP